LKLSVIILSKEVSNLLPCIEAVRRHEPEAEIIVVDDGLASRPESQGFRNPGFLTRFVNGVKPFVYARNVNVGLQEAYRHTVEYETFQSLGMPRGRVIISDENPDGVVLLNDDAILESPGGFSLLAEAAAADKSLGMVGGTTNVTGNRNQKRQAVGLRDEPRMITFLCVYIPRSTLELCGGLDERYVGYGCDDDDYSFTVRAHGLKLAVHDGCYVDHGRLKSSYRGAPGACADYRPNLQRFIKKWGCDNWGRPDGARLAH